MTIIGRVAPASALVTPAAPASRLRGRRLPVALLSAVMAGGVFTVAASGLLGYVRAVPIWVTSLAGIAVGLAARSPMGRRTSLLLGGVAAVVTAASLAATLYLVSRAHLVADLGRNYSVPRWMGWHDGIDFVRGTFWDHPVLSPLSVLSVVAAFVLGGGLWPRRT